MRGLFHRRFALTGKWCVAAPRGDGQVNPGRSELRHSRPVAFLGGGAEDEALARQFSAAPELEDVATALVACAIRGEVPGPELVERGRAAIAKATGVGAPA